MNESIFTVDHYFYYELVEKGQEFIDIAEMNQYLNRLIMLKLPKYPVEMMRNALEGIKKS
ncbi:hypothetical protein [Bacillus cereus group sp. BfR-BA-01380]|uniref:hypothetical protein n=1 Tax=Bacillus cereus group sp. BfR-BA-01380 TaxID=2920324 RepID=UPI001F57630D|nr:hypothetical protein [Bacillus cereus group sp. BfR-BA-01380]